MKKLPEKNDDLLYRKMIEEIEDYAIILLDKDGYIRNWNKGAEKIKQYKEQEIIGQHFSIFYLEEDRTSDLPRRLINEAERSGKAAQEGWRKRKDGTRFWGSITITATHDQTGAVIGFSKVTRDLTEKKASEDKLKMSEERYHQMVAEVQDYAIILLDEKGIIQNWNAGAEFIKGYSSSEVIGRSFEIFYTPQDQQNQLPSSLLTEAKTKGKAIHEGWRLRKDGSLFWGTIVITALHNKAGNIIGFSKVTRDLTQKKAADDKLLAYTEELKIQNGELEQFAYVASHDLQEPLRKIQTFTEMIREHQSDSEFVNKYLQKLDMSAKRLSSLVRSLLHYSRLSRERSAFDTVDLNVVLAEAKMDLELLIEEKHAAISNGTLPTIKGNHSQLGQLFSNLISNALKFSRADPQIKLEAVRIKKADISDSPVALTKTDYWQIDVEDNGIGFDQQYATTIFGLFHRLHGKDAYAGTGIGLALCKKIVENHQGWIAADGKANKGARFRIYLPVQ